MARVRFPSLTEVGMVDGDEYGCKIVECGNCRERMESHRSVYGCRKASSPDASHVCRTPLIRRLRRVLRIAA